MINFPNPRSSHRSLAGAIPKATAAGTSCESWLLTGCTGLVGRFVLRELLRLGKDVCVLARRRGPISAKERIEAIVQFWEEELQENLVRPMVLDANLLQSGLGQSDDVLEKLGGRFGGVLHCAASVRFDLDQLGQEPLRSNIDGTKNLIEFCQRIGVQHFHHVSTAYVCGHTNEDVLERTVSGSTRFRNPYEFSKAAAERLVRGADHFATTTIYRPSIVVGRVTDGFANAFHTLYSTLRLAREIEFHEVGGLVERAGMQGDEESNVVPVDWVASSITKIMNQPQSWGKVFHLTNPVPTKVEEIIGAIFNAVIRNLEHWKSIPAFGDQLASTSEAFDTHLGVYSNYFHDDPRFDRTNLESVPGIAATPRIDLEALTTVFEFAIQNKFCDKTGMASRAVSPAGERFSDLLDSKSEEEGAHEGRCIKVSVAGVGGGIWEIPSDGPATISELHVPMWVIESMLVESMSPREAVDMGIAHSNSRNAKETVQLLEKLIAQYKQVVWAADGMRTTYGRASEAADVN